MQARKPKPSQVGARIITVGSSALNLSKKQCSSQQAGIMSSFLKARQQKLAQQLPQGQQNTQPTSGLSQVTRQSNSQSSTPLGLTAATPSSLANSSAPAALCKGLKKLVSRESRNDIDILGL